MLRTLHNEFLRNFWVIQPLRFLTCIMPVFSYRVVIIYKIEAIDFLLERSVKLFFVACPIEVGVIEGTSTFDSNWFQLILIDRTAVARRTMRESLSPLCFPPIELQGHTE